MGLLHVHLFDKNYGKLADMSG